MQLIYEGNVYVKPQYRLLISASTGLESIYRWKEQMNGLLCKSMIMINHDWNNNSYGSMQPMNNKNFWSVQGNALEEWKFR